MLYQFKDYKGKQGYINKEGEIVISPIYDYVQEFSEGLARVNLKTVSRNWFG